MVNNKRNLLKILSIISIIMISVFTLTGCGKKEEKKEDVATSDAYLAPLKDYFEGIKNKNIEQLLKAFPDFSKMGEKITSEDINDLYTQYESIYGANIKIDYSFGDAVALNEEEIQELKTEISSIYPDATNVEITAAYTVPVKVTITGDGLTQPTESNENEQTENNEENKNVEEDEMYSIQYNGSWYLL